MGLPGTNLDGFLVFGIGFGIAIAVKEWAGVSGEGPLTIVGGGIVAILGAILQRARNGDPRNPHPIGPRIIFLPAWLLGVFWMALGIYYTVR